MRRIRTSTALSLALGLIVALSAATNAGQPASQPPQAAPVDMTKGIYISASQASAAVAATAAKQGTNPNAMTRLFQVGPYVVNIEHRLPLTQAAATHETEAELFVVIDGAATLVTGGMLVNPTKSGENITGTAIQGGTSQRMSKGDFMMIPRGVAHWITDVQGAFTPMTLHLPLAN